ncbi:ATP-binding protein [Corynebacterium sp.]|uniref:ATP-binding protein n=1 Tax=Corynebacterium sp. TaxID=1720 RepID=UPI0025BB8E1B|nr:ATP-binding protein [Corynebacterium sp.]
MSHLPATRGRPAGRPGSPTPDLFRVADGKVIAGVCTGLAAHLGVRLTAVRLVFALATTVAGVGVIAYFALWVFTTRVGTAGEASNSTSERSVRQRGLDPGLVNRPVAGVDRLLVVLALVLFLGGAAMRPQVAVSVLLLAGGVLLVWRTFGPNALAGASGPQGQPAPPGRVPGGLQWASLVGGLVLLAVGIGYTVFGIRVEESGDTPGGPTGAGGVIVPALIAAVALIAGLVVVLIPLWLRLWSMANTNARERAAEEERARIAARIHDSVLQTLTLIQKKSGEPEIAQMARSQERQLRQWLFAPGESVRTETLFGALRVACGEVEDTFGVQIRPVIVGEDRDTDDAAVALLLAGREAMVNAAKHSGCREVNVYLEVDDDGTVELFVRDRGPGFDVESIPGDRQGVRTSILDRMDRVGGSVEIDSGQFGTEVILRLEGQAR